MFEFKDIDDFKEKSGYIIDGFWYPRVTKIVEIKSKPALYRFYAGLNNFAEGERVKNKSAIEGTLIHDTVESILIGGNPSVSSSILPAIKAFLKFQSEKNIQVDPEYVECRLVNYKEKYAGTLDAIALIDGKLGVLDIKTSQEIYRDYNLQTSAYIEAMKGNIKDLETRWILRIDQSKKCLNCGATLRNKGGREKIKIQWNNSFMRACKHEWSEAIGQIELKEFPEWKKDYEAFLGAKKLWEWENEKILKEAGYL